MMVGDCFRPRSGMRDVMKIVVRPVGWLCLVFVTGILVVGQVTNAAAVPTTRLAGSDRYGTAVAVAQAAYPDGASAIVLATGENWPDAIGGSSLAGALNAPILLTRRGSIPPSVLNAIEALGPESVFVLGGPAAVSDEALAMLGRVGVDATAVIRVAGQNRYRTASMVASATIDELGSAWSGHAYLATGLTFADALSVGPVSAATGSPVYLTDVGRWSTTIASMVSAGVTDATILGGVNAVDPAVEKLLAEALGGAKHVNRVWGPDRYATATAIADHASATAAFDFGRLGMATGVEWADAATAGPYLGLQKAPLLLAAPLELSDTTASWLYANRGDIERYVEFGGSSALRWSVRQEAQHALVASAFNGSKAMSHIEYLAGLGPRAAGGTAELVAFGYIAATLRSYGYEASMQTVYLPGGGTSRNVIAEKTGTEPGVIVLGAHVDSKPPSPGGNDNASGVGVVLELARVLAKAPTAPTVRFVAFGAEEISGPTADDHHFGSRQYVAGLTSTQRARIQGMVSVDMVGYGSVLNVRSLRRAPQTVVNSLQARGSYCGQPVYFLLDPSGSGWSDHEAFEFAGIPAAWLEWRDDPVYHTVYDTAAHVQPERVRATGRLMRGWVLGMSPESLDDLR